MREPVYCISRVDDGAVMGNCGVGAGDALWLIERQIGGQAGRVLGYAWIKRVKIDAAALGNIWPNSSWHRAVPVWCQMQHRLLWPKAVPGHGQRKVVKAKAEPCTGPQLGQADRQLVVLLQPHCGWNKPCAAGDLVGLWRVTEPIVYKNVVVDHGGLDRLEQLIVAGLMRRLVYAQLRRLTRQYQRM